MTASARHGDDGWQRNGEGQGRADGKRGGGRPAGVATRTCNESDVCDAQSQATGQRATGKRNEGKRVRSAGTHQRHHEKKGLNGRSGATRRDPGGGGREPARTWTWNEGTCRCACGKKREASAQRYHHIKCASHSLSSQGVRRRALQQNAVRRGRQTHTHANLRERWRVLRCWGAATSTGQR